MACDNKQSKKYKNKSNFIRHINPFIPFNPFKSYKHINESTHHHNINPIHYSSINDNQLNVFYKNVTHLSSKSLDNYDLVNSEIQQTTLNKSVSSG